MKTIPLTRGQVAIIDDRNFPHFSQFKWLAVGQPGAWYAARRVRASERDELGGKKFVKMHHLVVRQEPGYFIDHRNGNRLDNRRCNLRQCTRSENAQNRKTTCNKKFKGIYQTESGRWRAWIRVQKKLINLGRYDTDIEAAQAYDRAARKLFGEFARLNFPDQGEEKVRTHWV